MEKCLELYVQNQFSVWCFIFYRLLQQCNNKSVGSFILLAVDNIWKNPFPTIKLIHHHLYLSEILPYVPNYPGVPYI